MKRKHVSNAPPSVQGHTCKICNLIGEHLEDACPSKSLVHMPRTFRKEVHDKTIVTIRETFFMPPDYLPGCELLPVLRERSDVPPELQCIACTKLVQDAIWCACCDVLACASCLGPPTEPYVCCSCRATSPDNFHVVGAVRALATAWLHALTRCADKHTFLSAKTKKPAAAI